MRCLFCSVVLATSAVTGAAAETRVVSGLAAAYRNGQVFLTWRERETPPGTTFNVYCADRPIDGPEALASARCLVRHIHAHSARDWWQDPASFAADSPPAEPVGFIIHAGDAPLDPASGLFVHTVTPDTQGQRFFAVTVSDGAGAEDRTVISGANVSAQPIACGVAQPVPVWQGEGELPEAGAGAGRGLCLHLHGRSGGATAGPKKSTVNCLWFADARQGWREGLPFKFRLVMAADTVHITPMDRVWVGRPVSESADRRDHCPAINTWWYGYHSEIYRTTDTPEAVAPNYTERYLLALVRWAQSYLGTDPNQTYITGASMGGSGTVAMALHFPHVFAAAYAQVPVYSCTRPGKGSARRLECMVGSLANRRVVTADGVPLLDYMNGAAALRQAETDMPPIFACNGRRDASIPWENDPPFYRAANDARQALSVYWNNGAHDMGRQLPADVAAWARRMYRCRLDESYLVFTNCSDNRDCGNGDPADGDPVGWINRGLDWQDPVDSDDVYEVTVTAVHPDITYPVTVDVTPRRIQRFRVRPGQDLHVRIGEDRPNAITVDRHGLFTIRNVCIVSAGGTRLAVRK